MSMQGNKLREEENGRSNGRPRKDRIGGAMKQVLGGNFLKKESTLRLLPFILFLALILMFYIANTYYAEKKERQIQALRKSLKELRYEYITTRSELMKQSRQSEVARRLEAISIKESTVPPVKVIKKNDYDKANND